MLVSQQIMALGGCLLTVFALCLMARPVEGWMVSQPKTNVWVTLVNVTHQDTLCLSLASPDNPFTTCLVGLPLDMWPCPPTTGPCKASDPKGNVDNWDRIYAHLPQVTQEPQELELLGSVMMDACVMFNYTYNTARKGQNVNATLSVYKNATAWCGYTATNIARSFNVPVALPNGVFLICGDRAWSGLPSKLNGGPCSLGRLTLLTPDLTMIHNKRWGKRSIHKFTEQCDDKVTFWGPGEIIAASVLAPGVAAAAALKKLSDLGCWLSKQTNATSLALSSLLTDVDSVRHATLQNRAAIDFLLLAQGHGCNEFEGMCCMNLSDHSVSIHKSIQLLREGVQNLQADDGWDWLNHFLRGWGLSGWFLSLVKTGLVVIVIVIVVLSMSPCLISLLKRALQQTVKAIFIAQIQKGGIVEDSTDLLLAEQEGINLEEITEYP